ncbi:MAG: HAD family phosphatase [Verrucomicrobia bacterium]|nr:HAD family phosphatase [Verrucomicrobiota bacterium]
MSGGGARLSISVFNRELERGWQRMNSDNGQSNIGHWKSDSLTAVIFDLDGVIVDSEPVHERAFRDVFAAIGHAATHGVHFPDYYGKSDVTVWKDFVARHRPPEPLDELVEQKQRRFLEILRESKPVFDALPALVASLAGRFKLAVASGSPHVVIDAVLGMEDLRRRFGAVVSADDVARGKPAPDVFLEAARRLGVAAAACCVIEDSVAGVQGARAAGMQVIGITTSFPREALAAAGAHHVVSRHADAGALLAPGE